MRARSGLIRFEFLILDKRAATLWFHFVMARLLQRINVYLGSFRGLMSLEVGAVVDLVIEADHDGGRYECPHTWVPPRGY